ncbi:hypothetical protein [Streptosporangium jomthongense]|uniref:Uncharacterized protein n=1 Tax=Streptosporangium jomthongense TaxID=1193683 RepID=A0ABV8FFX8_9ACTN
MLRVYALPCIRIPRAGDSPAWRLVLIIVLLLFVIAAHLLGVAVEMTTLMVTTVASTALRLTKSVEPSPKAL